MLPDPPVYVTEDDKNWTLCAPTTSEFLAVMDCGGWGMHGDGELQMLYGAASEASYASLMCVLEGVEEAI